MPTLYFLVNRFVDFFVRSPRIFLGLLFEDFTDFLKQQLILKDVLDLFLTNLPTCPSLTQQNWRALSFDYLCFFP